MYAYFDNYLDYFTRLLLHDYVARNFYYCYRLRLHVIQLSVTWRSELGKQDSGGKF